MLVQDFLQNTAHLFPDKTALIYRAQHLTYSQIDESANALAHTLVKQGLEPGDRVAVCLPNCPEAAIAVFGVLKASGIFVFLNSSIKEKKLRYILNNCRASALICGPRHARIFLNHQEDFPTVQTVIHVGGSGHSHPESPKLLHFDMCLEQTNTDRPTCTATDTDIACIIYTSGSTGEPKGVVCGHDNIAFTSNSIITYLENTPEDVVINVLPFSFDYGLYQLLMVLRFGGTLVLEPAFVYPQKILKRIETEKVTGFPIVPTMLAILLQTGLPTEQLRSLRYITNTAAAVPVNHIRSIREKLPWVRFYSMYGLTECKRTLYLPPEQIDIRPSSVGIAIPGTQVWLEDDKGHRLGPGATGELVTQGPHVMRGYWENPEATSSVYKEDPTTGTRMLYSGDLFRMDEEGYLYFLSRKDDIIKSRGEKISPREIEDAAYSIEGVTEAAAIGLPDPILGQKIKLLVTSSDPSLREIDIKRRCREQLEDFMVPQIVEIRDRLPKTNSGKIRKSGLH
jgi:long-chain acyl-CoA synthetase